MIKYTRLFITFLLAIIISEARAQSTATSSSPYSRYGLGTIDDQLLPQNIGMGGIITATNTIGNYNNINIINPASYSKLQFTVIDAGFFDNIVTLNTSGSPSQKTSNTSISHIVFAFPLTKASAISFGLLPYSQMGYNNVITKSNFGTGAPADTNSVNYIYSGDGGVSKLYVGYGFGIGKHLSLGANASYLFGNLLQDRATEIPNDPGFLNSKIEVANHVRGFNFDFGAQYSIDFSTTKHLTLGYSNSIGNKINVRNEYIVSQYFYDATGIQNVAADSLIKTTNPNAKMQLPLINHFGIVYQKDAAFQNGASFMIGADYTMGGWSNFSVNGVNPGLQNSRTFNFGGQITPNPSALSNYLAVIDYRAGIIYEDTYVKINGESIKRRAVTFGLGIPLPHDRAASAFYKVNFSAEVGKRGNPNNGLVQENYVNLHLGFLLNDRWFQRFKFD